MRSLISRSLTLGAPLAMAALVGCGTPDVGPGPEGVALRSFQNCDELEGYVEDAILETLVESAFGYGRWVEDVATPGADDSGSDSDGPSDYTGTNNQEEGVDELDIVKTNGTHIFAVENGKLYIVKSWPVADAALLDSVEVDGYAQGLFLEGDTAIVVSQVWQGYDENGNVIADDALASRSGSFSRLTLLDVSDPEAPTVTRTIDIEGYLVNGRLIGGKGYFVINTWMPIPQEFWDILWDGTVELPEWNWEDTEEQVEAKREEARRALRPHVARLAAQTDLSEFLPLYRDQEEGASEAPVTQLHECTDVYRPANTSHYSVLNIVELDVAGDGGVESTALLSDGWNVYASKDNLYVSQTSWWWWWGFGDDELETHIHQFALEDSGPKYVGSGSVPGWTQSQFAFSEYDGHLRVATTDVDWWWGTGDREGGNNIFVLKNEAGTLAPVGELTGLAPDEQIYGVRMMGEKGYLVTFRQTDPLWTIDLSDPTEPTVAGELMMPGYSSYLHPIDADHLLAIGMAGEEDGTITGLAVNVFDVSDFANPRLAHQWTLESDDWSWSEALWDHHAFTYHRGVLTFPAYTWTDLGDGAWDYFSGVVVLEAGPDGISELGRVDHRDMVAESDCLYDWGCEESYSYAWMRRTVYIEDNLFSMSNYGLKVNELNAPENEIATVVFEPN